MEVMGDYLKYSLTLESLSIDRIENAGLLKIKGDKNAIK